MFFFLNSTCLVSEGGGLLRTCALRPSGIYGPDERRHLYRVMVSRWRQHRVEKDGVRVQPSLPVRMSFTPSTLLMGRPRHPVTAPTGCSSRADAAICRPRCCFVTARDGGLLMRDCSLESWRNQKVGLRRCLESVSNQNKCQSSLKICSKCLHLSGEKVTFLLKYHLKISISQIKMI